MGGKKLYFQCDISYTYGSVKIEEGARKLTGILTPFGTYTYITATYGLAYVPMTLCKLLQIALEESYSTECVVFYDDLAGGAKDSEKLYISLERMLGKLRARKLSVNPRKLFIGRHTIEF